MFGMLHEVNCHTQYFIQEKYVYFYDILIIIKLYTQNVHPKIPIGPSDSGGCLVFNLVALSKKYIYIHNEDFVEKRFASNKLIIFGTSLMGLWTFSGKCNF